MAEFDRIPESKKEWLLGLVTPYDFKLVDLPNTGGVPDGNKDVTHPSIVYVPEGWNGYTHWMAATPYPKTETLVGEDYENSCIYYANGDTWHKHPIAFTPIPNNPIIPTPYHDGLGYIVGFNSDSELFLFENTMYCITRARASVLYGGAQNTLLLQSSTDGFNWTEPVVIYNSSSTVDLGELSPMYSYENGKHRIYITRNYRKLGATIDNTRTFCIAILESESLITPNFQLVGYSTIEGLANIWHGGMFIYNNKKYIIAGGTHDGYINDVRGLFLGEQIEGTNDFMFYDKPIIAPFGNYRPTAFVDGSTLVVYDSIMNKTISSQFSDSADYPSGNFVAKFEWDMEWLLSELRKRSLVSI